MCEPLTFFDSISFKHLFVTQQFLTHVSPRCNKTKTTDTFSRSVQKNKRNITFQQENIFIIFIFLFSATLWALRKLFIAISHIFSLMFLLHNSTVHWISWIKGQIFPTCVTAFICSVGTTTNTVWEAHSNECGFGPVRMKAVNKESWLLWQ